MSHTQRILTTEVHNVGGFFGGDTITLSAVPWPDGDEITLTIDERALANMPSRYVIAPEMLLDLAMRGDQVEQAVLLGARSFETLHAALRLEAAPLPAPRVYAYHCASCNLWIVAADGAAPARCTICGAPVPGVAR